MQAQLPTPLERIGGEAFVKTLVTRFYDLIDENPTYAALRAVHSRNLSPMRQSLTGFLVAWLGGSRQWFEEHKNVCVMSMHRALPVTPETAEQWLDAMRTAMEDTEVDPDTSEIILSAFTRMARGMISSVT